MSPPASGSQDCTVITCRDWVNLFYKACEYVLNLASAKEISARRVDFDAGDRGKWVTEGKSDMTENVTMELVSIVQINTSMSLELEGIENNQRMIYNRS